ncbi:MAG TPA: DUF3108 domain-containing protein [Hyphomicrobiaceae bacterium]|jgi:hypothetical protein|nr:DUF3108 domain-containing protein [Hyphomicrobiaceae bacterium]
MTQRPRKLALSHARHLIFGLLGLLAGLSPAHADSWPTHVRATYDVNFNGINIGTFEFESQAERQNYTLAASAHLSILLGAYKWSGHTHSFGLIANQAPKPESFSYDFKANKKTGHTKMGFTGDAVTNIVNVPPAKIKPNIIPVREQHLRDVLDPLSAVMSVTRGPMSNPCDRRVPIFDGKERFDLLLSYKGQTKVEERHPSGQPGTAYVCRVRYVPIAGHKIDSKSKFIASTDAIEITLRPIPSANVFVPYQVTIPTLVGNATVVSKKIEIVSPGKPQIALTH